MRFRSLFTFTDDKSRVAIGVSSSCYHSRIKQFMTFSQGRRIGDGGRGVGA